MTQQFDHERSKRRRERKSESITARTRPSLKAAIGELAARDKRSVADYVGLVLEDHVARSRAA
jgi:hypothetical protein